MPSNTLNQEKKVHKEINIDTQPKVKANKYKDLKKFKYYLEILCQ